MSKKFNLAGDYVLKCYEECGAIKENGHFVLSSGCHTSVYIDHYALLADTKKLSVLGNIIAELILKNNIYPDSIVGPELGGWSLALFVAKALSHLNGKTYAVPARKKTYERKLGFYFPESFFEDNKIINKKLVIVDDVMTTGDTFEKIINLCYGLGGKVKACICLWDRGGVIADCDNVYGIPLYALLEKRLEDFSEKECMQNGLCKKGVPINTKYGHGQEFLDGKLKEKLL